METKIKVNFKNGTARYYKGKNSHGQIFFTDNETEAYDYSPRAKGAMNQISNRISATYGVKCEYV